MGTRRRKIAIFTGNRAEYGLQYPIISAIARHPKLEYYLFVGGAHLDEDFGYTKREIEEDGFTVWREIKAETKADDLLSTTQAIGHIILNLSEALSKLEPDVLVVYADRFEGFAAVIAGSQMGIPVAHIEGGDITKGGALDDYVRHSMTKLSHLHFTTNKEAARRIEKLGEEKWRIFNTGYPLIDLIKQKKFATLQEIQQKLPLDVEEPIIILTQHSITTELEDVTLQIRPSLEALEFYSRKGVQVIITYPNNDAGGRRIIKEVERVSKRSNIIVVPHLGRHLYHGILNLCGKEGLGVCVGNSSSGIKETPAFGCPFVHIGSRQEGRLRSTNIIDTGYDKDQVVKAIEKSLFDRKFREECRKCKNPYGKGDAGKNIAETLANIRIDRNLIQKEMTY
ncbi:MAG: UDP-N-acetylglucosamine 2-epimerase [Planctomycetota bacterium]|jgi:UDP-N-acetylglucosamine 2-epimerase (non-hydrolysing)/GDP/UDP-N,N'-diacetylbacillosamine 2-epimerase (hydrolysing)